MTLVSSFFLFLFLVFCTHIFEIKLTVTGRIAQDHTYLPQEIVEAIIKFGSPSPPDEPAFLCIS